MLFSKNLPRLWCSYWRAHLENTWANSAQTLEEPLLPTSTVYLTYAHGHSEVGFLVRAPRKEPIVRLCCAVTGTVVLIHLMLAFLSSQLDPPFL